MLPFGWAGPSKPAPWDILGQGSVMRRTHDTILGGTLTRARAQGETEAAITSARRPIRVGVPVANPS